jgi:hypothetical protein
MPMFRHHALLLAQEELVEGPITGPAFRVRPSDGDGVSDQDQHWVAVFDLLREGEGLVTATLSTSFDGVLWHPIASVNTKRGAQVIEFAELKAFAPWVRVETAVQVEGSLSKHRLVVRLASDGPFSVVPG